MEVKKKKEPKKEGNGDGSMQKGDKSKQKKNSDNSKTSKMQISQSNEQTTTESTTSKNSKDNKHMKKISKKPKDQDDQQNQIMLDANQLFVLSSQQKEKSQQKKSKQSNNSQTTGDKNLMSDEVKTAKSPNKDKSKKTKKKDDFEIDEKQQKNGQKDINNSTYTNKQQDEDKEQIPSLLENNSHNEHISTDYLDKAFQFQIDSEIANKLQNNQKQKMMYSQYHEQRFKSHKSIYYFLNQLNIIQNIPNVLKLNDQLKQDLQKSITLINQEFTPERVQTIRQSQQLLKSQNNQRKQMIDIQEIVFQLKNSNIQWQDNSSKNEQIIEQFMNDSLNISTFDQCRYLINSQKIAKKLIYQIKMKNYVQNYDSISTKQRHKLQKYLNKSTFIQQQLMDITQQFDKLQHLINNSNNINYDNITNLSTQFV